MKLQSNCNCNRIHLYVIGNRSGLGSQKITVTGITEITKITEITTEITMEITKITIKGWDGVMLSVVGLVGV